MRRYKVALSGHSEKASHSVELDKAANSAADFFLSASELSPSPVSVRLSRGSNRVDNGFELSLTAGSLSKLCVTSLATVGMVGALSLPSLASSSIPSSSASVPGFVPQDRECESIAMESEKIASVGSFARSLRSDMERQRLEAGSVLAYGHSNVVPSHGNSDVSPHINNVWNNHGNASGHGNSAWTNHANGVGSGGNSHMNMVHGDFVF